MDPLIGDLPRHAREYSVMNGTTGARHTLAELWDLAAASMSGILKIQELCHMTQSVWLECHVESGPLKNACLVWFLGPNAWYGSWAPSA